VILVIPETHRVGGKDAGAVPSGTNRMHGAWRLGSPGRLAPKLIDARFAMKRSLN
jgi:hypothetical protein